MKVKKIPKSSFFENGWIDFRLSHLDNVTLLYDISVWNNEEPQRKQVEESGFVKDRKHLKQLRNIKRVSLPKITFGVSSQ